MKKIYFFILSFLLVGNLIFAQETFPLILLPSPPPKKCPETLILKRGEKGYMVKALQQILKQDPTIYPAKLETGFYGPLTEKAVRRLQRKLGVPVTGRVDERTAPLIFLCNVKITVISPNGGETWETGRTYKITWTTSELPSILFPPDKSPIKPLSEPSVMPPKAPLLYTVSLDLVKKLKPGEVEIQIYPRPISYHISVLPLRQGEYNWTIGENIAPGEYKVRITLKASSAFDESDNWFEVVKKEVPVPFSQPPYPQPSFDKVKLERTIQLLKQAVELLQELLK